MEQVQPETDDQEAPATDYYSSHNKYATGANSQAYRDPTIAWARDRNGALLPDHDTDDYHSSRGKDGELWLASCTCCSLKCATAATRASCAACMHAW